MKWRKDGSVELIDQVKLGIPKTLEAPREDEESNQSEVDTLMKIESDDDMQRTHVLEYKIFFDDLFLAKHKTTTEAKKQLKATMAHTQAKFCHESLGSKIT